MARTFLIVFFVATALGALVATAQYFGLLGWLPGWALPPRS
jgi:hypothetical protein